MNLPYLTPDFPGIGGNIKQRPEDFFVQELPLYEPSGEGEHVYFEVQKIGLTTFETIDRLVRALNIAPQDIGYAGMKDAKAVSRQIFSARGTTEKTVMDLRIPDITVQWAARHGNKLRLGHLSGNRFAIKIRDVNPLDVVKLGPVIETIKTRGMPNYFGEQRFGRRGDNAILGAALIAGNHEEVLKQLLGRPNPEVDSQQQIQARAAFDRRENAVSMKHWPRKSGLERRVLARLIKSSRPGHAVRMIDERLRRLWVNALQSQLFNEVLSARIQTIDKVTDGDLAMKEDNGAVFLVESAATEQPRCEAFEISPTGPIVGYRMTAPGGEQLRIEQDVFTAHGLTPGSFRIPGRHKVKGARRALRVKPRDVELSSGVDDEGGYITVAFSLPAGSFATIFLRELMKSEESTENADSVESGSEDGADSDEGDLSAHPLSQDLSDEGGATPDDEDA